MGKFTLCSQLLCLDLPVSSLKDFVQTKLDSAYTLPWTGSVPCKTQAAQGWATMALRKLHDKLYFPPYYPRTEISVFKGKKKHEVLNLSPVCLRFKFYPGQ